MTDADIKARLEQDLIAARYENRRLAKKIASYSINRDLELLNPDVRSAFINLADHLRKSFRDGKTDTLFEPFEAFRSPVRQRELYEQKPQVTKAGPWKSAHQYGLAVDFVPIVNGNWNWHEGNDYAFLATSAGMFGLSVPYTWDKVHVEHPLFREARRIFM